MTDLPDLETGLFNRVRRWTDVLGWLRLVAVLRVAASPSLLLVTAAAMIVDRLGQNWFFGDHAMVIDQLGRGHSSLIEHLIRISPVSAFWWPFAGGWWTRLFSILWSLLVWVSVVILLTRQGALLAADRSMVGVSLGLRYALRRSWSGGIAAIMPLVCVGFIGLAALAVGGLAHAFEGASWPTILLGWISALICVPAGTLAFGGIAAVPLAWAAIANERDPDALDSLSRGYEYVYRRPLQLLGYLAVAAIVLTIVFAIASGVGLAAKRVAGTMLSIANAPEMTIAAAGDVCDAIPIIVQRTLFWSLIGGVYLLIRSNANGQEVEDLWQPQPDQPPELPTLRVAELGVAVQILAQP